MKEQHQAVMPVLILGWTVLGVFLAVQKNWVGVLACLVGGGIMVATLVYTRTKRRGQT